METTVKNFTIFFPLLFRAWLFVACACRNKVFFFVCVDCVFVFGCVIEFVCVLMFASALVLLFAFVFAFAVDEFEPVMVSPAWNTPVSELDLLITNLLFGMSSLRIVPVAFDVPPVMFSPF